MGALEKLENYGTGTVTEALAQPSIRTVNLTVTATTTSGITGKIGPSNDKKSEKAQMEEILVVLLDKRLSCLLRPGMRNCA